MNDKLKAFSAATSRTANLAIEAIIKDLTATIKDKTYARQKNLPKLIDIHNKFLLDPPVIATANNGDVATTVHILSELQSRLSYLDIRLLSGVYDEDYNTRARLVHAIMRENEILHGQMEAVENLEKGEIAAQQHEKVSNINKAKAAS